MQDKIRVYFSASTRDFLAWRPFYRKILDTIKKAGGVLTRDWITCTEDSIKKGLYELTDKQWREIYQQVVKAVKEAEVLIVENSNPSFSSGYLTYLGLSLGKPTLLLQKLRRGLSFVRGFVAGVEHPLLSVVFYSYEQQAFDAISRFLKEAKDKVARKSFHLKLSVEEYNKLTRLKLKTGKSRTRIIRELIEGAAGF